LKKRKEQNKSRGDKTMSQIYNADYLAFQPRLAPASDDEIMVERGKDKILKMPYEILPDKKVKFSLYYPNGKSVQISNYLQTFDLNKDGDYWTGEFFVGEGCISLFVILDGCEILSRFLPIGYGSNRPINFIEVPEDDFSFESKTKEHGVVVNEYIENKITGQMERVLVYLPFDYFSSDKRYPVIYLQHGHGENEIAWVNQGHVNFLMDNLISEGKAVPAIIVMSNGMHFEEKQDVRILKINIYNEFLINELIPYIDNKYRTIPEPSKRAMAGLSMGSIQASTVGFLRSDLFAYVGVFSGFLSNFITGENEHLSEENLENFKKNNKLLFRAIGDKDIYMELFNRDEDILSNAGITQTKEIYNGLHEWKVWRKCFVDFSSLLF